MVADANREAGLVKERKLWNKSTTNTGAGTLVLLGPLGGPAHSEAEWMSVSPECFLLGSGSCSAEQVGFLQAWPGASQSHILRMRPHFPSHFITPGPREAALLNMVQDQEN